MRGGAGILATGVALVALVGVATASGSPIVSAGLDQEVELGDTVYLDGGGTHVPDGELERIEWSIETPDGRTITPNCVDCERTSFQPNETGQYDVTLTAWSDSGVERSDTLYVTVDSPSTPTMESDETGGGSSGESDRCFLMSFNETVDCSQAPEMGGTNSQYEVVADENNIYGIRITDPEYELDFSGTEPNVNDNTLAVSNSALYVSREEIDELASKGGAWSPYDDRDTEGPSYNADSSSTESNGGDNTSSQEATSGDEGDPVTSGYSFPQNYP